MRKGVTSALVFWSIAGTALGTVCETSLYVGTNFYDNLVQAAAFDWSRSGVAHSSIPIPGDKKSRSALATALNNNDVSSPGHQPYRNTALVGILNNMGSECGSCAYDFYKNVYDSFVVTTPDNFDCTVDHRSSGSYYTPNAYSAWAVMSPLSPATELHQISSLQSLACVSRIQAAIDRFNGCANNGFDVRLGVRGLTACSNQDDFINLDAQFGAYKVMMDYALQNIALSDEFKNAYTALPCRSCFDSFMANVASQASVLWKTVGSTPGTCQSGAGAPFTAEYYDSANCLLSTGVVAGYVGEFEICAGTYNQLYTNQRFPPSADITVLFNSIAKVYESLVFSSAGFYTSPDTISNSTVSVNAASIVPSLGLTTYLVDSVIEGSSSVFVISDAADFGCFQHLAYTVYNAASTPANGATTDCGSGTGNGPFTANCLSDLANNSTNANVLTNTHSSADSALVTFYKCSGFKLDTTPTTCSKAQIATIPSEYKTYAPVLEIAIAAGTNYVLAGKNVIKNADGILSDSIIELPCSSCYARLGAELAQNMSANDIALCANPYSYECMTATNVVNALQSFKNCSGFALNNTSLFECSAEEWGILNDESFSQQVFDLVVSERTLNLLQAKYQYELMISSVMSAHASDSFKCNYCYEQLVSDLYELSDDSKTVCETNINSGECYAEAVFAFDKFKACSGRQFQWEAIVDQIVTTTTSVPTETAVETTVAPETTTEIPTTTETAPETKGGWSSVSAGLTATVVSTVVLVAIMG